MPLSGPVNHSHPAAADLFHYLVIAQPPLLVGDVRFSEHRLEVCNGILLLGFEPLPKEATQTDAIVQSRSSATLFALVRADFDSGNRLSDTVHGRSLQK